MPILIISLFILVILLSVAFKITGVLLKALLWLFIFIPIGFAIVGVGIIICCTVILIPIGMSIVRSGIRVITRG